MGRREWYGSVAKGEKEVPGCMSGFLQFFNFHHNLFTPNNGGGAAERSSPHSDHYPSQLKGVEAPRNSLELDDEAAAASTDHSALTEEYYGIPIGFQLNSGPSLMKKKKKRDLLLLVEEEKRSSQSGTPRTPSVVARLMGLDIFPDGASTPTPLGFKSQDRPPKVSEKKKMMHDSKRCFVDAPCKEPPPRRHPLKKRDTNLLPNVRLEVDSRSLPDTPRASSERPRDADRRLSLQLNKENSSRATHLLPLSPTRTDYTNRSRRRDILKAQESIHRRGNSNASGDDHVIRSRRTSPTNKKVLVENESKYFTASPPPPQNSYHEHSRSQVPTKPPRQHLAPFCKVREKAKPIKMAASKCNKASYQGFTERIKRQPPPPEKIKSRYTVTGTTSRETSHHPISPPSPQQIRPVSTIPTQEQRQLFQHHQRRGIEQQDPEFVYVRSILERAGIMSTTQVIRWYSPSLPIDPFVFHHLELDLPLFHSLRDHDDHNPLRHRCNRKLLFHLVEEVLRDLRWSATPSAKQPTKRFHETNQESLLDRLWTQIRSFHLLADYRVTTEDTNALIAGDLAEAQVRLLLDHPLVAAEGESIAMEIEEDVLDTVIGEAAATLTLRTRQAMSVP